MNATHLEVERALERDFLSRHPAQAVRMLETLSMADIAEIVLRHPPEVLLPVWERMSPDIGHAVLEALPESEVATVLSRLDSYRAAALLAGFADDRRERYLSLVPGHVATELREVLVYPTDRAGALMDPKVRLFRDSMTVKEILSRLKADRRPGRRGLFVVDADNRLAGWVDMQEIALARPGERLATLASPVVASVGAMASREEVVETMEQYRISDLAVTDLDGVLVGIVRYGGLVAAERAQASVGIQTMVGVSKDERALSTAAFAVRKRLPWLQINLLTAFLAASVVGLFESTIAAYTALAVLLPVVAGQSGNTGAQALAVTMRGLALREIRVRHWPRIVLKEAKAGFGNGVAVALTTAIGVLVWSGSTGLCLVIGVSMVLSMMIASVSGAAIPVLLTVARQDPAQSSSIILTTITDVAGFFSFLGIATLLAALL